MPPSEQQELLRATAKDFAERELAPIAATVDEREEFPEEAFRGLASLGLCGLTISEDAGGAGGGYADIATVIEEAGPGPAWMIPIIANKRWPEKPWFAQNQRLSRKPRQRRLPRRRLNPRTNPRPNQLWARWIRIWTPSAKASTVP